jgi:hypothetical protein
MIDAKPGPWRKPVKNNDFSCKPAPETGENLPPRRGGRQVLPAPRPIFLRVARADMACYANIDLET